MKSHGSLGVPLLNWDSPERERERSSCFPSLEVIDVESLSANSLFLDGQQLSTFRGEPLRREPQSPVREANSATT